MYRIEKLFDNKMIRRLSDNVIIPVDPPKQVIDEKGDSYFIGGNIDYIEYTNWLSLGNIPEEIDITPIPTIDDLRKQAYDVDKCDIHSLIVALWEKVIEDRPDAAEDIQAKRMIIKEQYLKEQYPKE